MSDTVVYRVPLQIGGESFDLAWKSQEPVTPSAPAEETNALAELRARLDQSIPDNVICEPGAAFLKKLPSLADAWEQCENSFWGEWLVQRVCPLTPEQSAEYEQEKSKARAEFEANVPAARAVFGRVTELVTECRRTTACALRRIVGRNPFSPVQPD